MATVESVKSDALGMLTFCPSCATEFRKSEDVVSRKLCGVDVSVRVPSVSCECDSLISGAHMLAAERLLAFEVLSKRPQHVDGDAFRFCRKSIGMKRRDLATAMVIAEDVVESIERGDSSPSRLHVLGLLAILSFAMETSSSEILSSGKVRMPWVGGEVSSDLAVKV